jgi:hypothetical protein
MVTLTCPRTSPYSAKEESERRYFASRISRQHLPSRETHRLPWSKRPAHDVLDADAWERLELAIEHAKETGYSRTLLVQETDALWIVHVEVHPVEMGLRLTWRFICRDQE